MTRQIFVFVGLSGLLVGGLGVALVPSLSNWWYASGELDLRDSEQVREFVKALPHLAWLIVLIFAGTGPAVGTWLSYVATSRRTLWPTLVVWCILGIATLSTLLAIPHPWWMWPAELHIVAQQENDMVRLESEMAGTVWDTRFTVKPVGSTVVLEAQVTATARTWFARLLTVLVFSMVNQATAEDMDRLTSYCEQESRP